MSTYSVTIAQKVDTLANYKAWGQSFGAALSSFGWSAQSGHGENVASGSGGSYAWTNVAAAPTTTLQPMASYNFKGAWVSGTTYVGSNTANNTADVVTNGGLTYVHITASSSLTTAPGSDTTNWQPLIFEIWKSNGSNSSALPIYLKIVYTTNANATPLPSFHLAIGTGVDSNGNITSPIIISASNPTTTALVGATAGSPGTATTADMDFSGDADNFRFITFRGSTITSNLVTNVLVIDRAKTSAGVDSDGFVYVGSVLTVAGSPVARSSVILKSTLGGIIAQTNAGWCGAVQNGVSATPVVLNNFGATTPFPILPLVGYVANPLLGCIGVNRTDVVDGTILPAWVYGASHNYLICALPSAAGNSITNVATNGVVPAILWE